MEHHVDEPFPLNAEPTQSGYAYIEVCQLVVVAVETDLMLIKLYTVRAFIVGRSE